MKLIKLTPALLLATFGAFVIYWNMAEATYLYNYSGITSGLIIIFWSILLGIAQKKSYKGGAASIIGTVLFTGAIALLVNLCFFTEYTNLKLLKGVFSTSLLLIAGVALLKQGHQFHRTLGSLTHHSSWTPNGAP